MPRASDWLSSFSLPQVRISHLPALFGFEATCDADRLERAIIKVMRDFGVMNMDDFYADLRASLYVDLDRRDREGNFPVYFKAWVVRSARNLALKWQRKERSIRESISLEDLDEDVEQASDYHFAMGSSSLLESNTEALMREEEFMSKYRFLYESLPRLTLAERAAMELHLKSLESDETCELMTPAQQRALSRAREHVRHLAEEEQEEGEERDKIDDSKADDRDMSG